MKSSIFAALATVAAILPYVSAHGSVSQVVIDGKAYKGNLPGSTSPVDSPIRMISEVDPVKGATNANLACGQSAQPAKLTVPANPGSNLQISWINGNGGDWPHNTGPIINYMASCGGNDCSTFDPTNAKWFKIEQSGQDSDGTWAQAAIMAGKPFDLTLPENLSPGGYLLRHEIIALQLAVSVGGAEFYPSCIQMLVGGSGNGVPSPTVSFPGAYSDNDPGIFDADVYNPGSTYTFPGGPVSNLASPGAGSSSNTTSPAASGTASSAPSSSALMPSASSAAPVVSSSQMAPSPSSTKTCKPGQTKRMVKRHNAKFFSH